MAGKTYHNRRYYLHQQLKGKYQVDGRHRTIHLPYARFSDIPIPDRYYVGQLIRLGYNIQLNLFTPPITGGLKWQHDV